MRMAAHLPADASGSSSSALTTPLPTACIDPSDDEGDGDGAKKEEKDGGWVLSDAIDFTQ